MMSLCVFRPVLLTLTLLLCSGSVSTLSEFVEEGGSVTLPCKNLREGQKECDGTTWVFNSVEKPQETIELIMKGKNGSRVPQTLSNRLRVTQKCDLQIHNVHPQEAGLFSCQQYDQSRRFL
ncbi:hypothetical protein NL108_013673 [Boleophthalmus pectinirostris]|nr:hypothetical protein NL108_013673 [Boleophthalmus pectinirostris]